MRHDISDHHPLKEFFRDALHESLTRRLGIEPGDDVQGYLVDMLVRFLHSDEIFDIRNAFGRPVESVVEMIEEGDVRFKADSFEREREVHRHIGDFLLFWSGLYPEFLQALKSASVKDAMVDVVRQGQMSYHLVSTFEYPPHDREAGTFRELSAGFAEYQLALRLVRSSFDGFDHQTDWADGFRA